MNLDQPHLVVMGAGAMGGLFGGLLAEGGLRVTLVDAWAEHIETMRAQGGLRMVGVGGDRIIPLTATTDVSSIPAADVVDALVAGVAILYAFSIDNFKVRVID